ncbi:DUF3048 domain-containing protein [Peribacillus sp. SCS-26]|uniref:DUF3048 domain-containing protein n=1 Tax=Paraperibacillus marinus TaxID=3115295 RepID=UPI0039069FB6
MRLKIAYFMLAAILLTAGCSKEEPKEPGQKEAAPKQEEKQKPPAAKEYKYTFPLTGEGTDTKPDRRAVSVMINNHPAARPQSGLAEADIVYELLAEGEVTRFLAVFQSGKPGNIGPVRSARDYFMELAKGFDSLYILHGYSPEAKRLLAGGYIDHLNGLKYDGSLFERSDFRKAPHNSYITYKNIIKGAKQNDFDMLTPPKSMTFISTKQVPIGKPAPEAEVSYHSSQFDVRYEYDRKKGKYLRYTAGEPTIDLETDKSIQLDNILIIEAPHRITDEKGRRDIDLHSGGPGYLLQKGTYHEVTWKWKDGRIVPMMKESEAGLIAGKTWVNIVPSLSDVSLKP